MLDPIPRLKMMAEKLYIEVQHGRIDNEFAESFIPRVYGKLKQGQPLTDKEVTKLEELFEEN